jgi:drug/metabolite transporter (DMT)-like permease
MKTAAVLALAVLSQAAGNTLLSRAMRQIASVDHSWFSTLRQALAEPAIWLGTVLVTTFFLLYAASLSWADLSFVLPATSFGYVLNVAFAHYFLSESVSALRWGGTLLIAIGVVVVSRSGTNTTRERSSQTVFSGIREDSK